MVEKGSSAKAQFGIKLFDRLLNAIVTSTSELDVDLLLMLKDELFLFHDCTYFGFIAVKELIQDAKDMHSAAVQQAIVKQSKTDASSSSSSSSSSDISPEVEVRVKNLIDIMRVLSVPTELDDSNYLVPTGSHANNDQDGADDSDADSVNDSDDEQARTEEEALKPKKGNNKRNLAASRPTTTDASKSNKKQRRLPRGEQVYHLAFYRKAFSKSWLALLSLPLSVAQHKLLLKHLPNYVISVMTKPILLADYLTQSYNKGGAVAVLALESLFTLIATYNLDYPNFFVSLYNLCTVEVFSAKYRNKFMKLLNASLKSTNLPAYLVAAFIKRLAHLALHTPSPNAPFCIGQLAWLLRQHPQTQVLIHRAGKTLASFDPKVDFNNGEAVNIEAADALKSSLWEMDFLEKHHLYSVSTVATSLKEPTSTQTGRDSTYVPLQEFLDLSYGDMIESELGASANADKAGKKAKRNAALAYKKPSRLMEEGGLISQCFGSDA